MPTERLWRDGSQRAWIVLLVVFVGWSAWFVYRTSFEIHGVRYFSLFDDAMISSSYAQNLVEGRGFRWDGADDPVEGFTSPVWTLAMSAAHLPFVPVRYGSLVVQLLSLGLLVLTLLLLRRLMTRHLAPADSGPPGWFPACFLTAGFYPLSYWALAGMETGLQACLAVAGTLLALEVTERGRRDRLLPLGVVMALAYTTRMDMVPWICFVLAFLAWRDPSIVRTPRFWGAVGLLATAALGYQAFRLVYFGEGLPNPYHLKMTGIPLGLRLVRGLPVTLRGLGLALPLAGAVLFLAIRWRDRRPSLVLLATPIWIYAAYSIWVGGDAWERAGIGANRFLAWAMPLLFAALNGSWNVLVARRPRARRLTWAAAAATLLAVLVVPGRGFAHRASDLLVLDPPFQVDDHARVLRDFLALRRHFPERLAVTTVYAGIPAVFTDFRLVDFLGYTDRRIATGPPALDLGSLPPERYEPGHVKWDLDYVLDERRPDIVLHTFGIPREQIVPELRERGYRDVHGLWLAPWVPSPFSEDG